MSRPPCRGRRRRAMRAPRLRPSSGDALALRAPPRRKIRRCRLTSRKRFSARRCRASPTPSSKQRCSGGARGRTVGRQASCSLPRRRLPLALRRHCRRLKVKPPPPVPIVGVHLPRAACHPPLAKAPPAKAPRPAPASAEGPPGGAAVAEAPAAPAMAASDRESGTIVVLRGAADDWRRMALVLDRAAMLNTAVALQEGESAATLQQAMAKVEAARPRRTPSSGSSPARARARARVAACVPHCCGTA